MGPSDGGRSLEDVFRAGRLEAQLSPRVSPAGQQVVRQGGRTYTLSLSVDRSGRIARLLEVRDGAALAWRVEEAAAERLQSFAVHPSGAVTLGVERLDAETDAYDLVRLDSAGQVLHRGALQRPVPPPGDLPPDAGTPFAMKGVRPRSVVRGWLPWLTLQPRGEDVVAGILSYADSTPPSGPDGALITAVTALRWTGAAFEPEWARVVDRVHSMVVVAWQYDEFQWMDATARLLVVVDDEGVLVGRTVYSGRCSSLVALGELSESACRRVRSVFSHRYQPFAVTRFGPQGERLGTWTYVPDGRDELVIFGMAASGQQVALVGTEVRLGDAGEPDWYFEPPGQTGGTRFSPYDALLAVVDRATGAVVQQQHVDLGRGELLAAVRFTPQGLVAGGASDWNRWNGGMSVSRGARPLLVLAPLDGGVPLVREGPGASGDRHTHLLALDVEGPTVLGVGPSDAPMTHSGDTSEAENATGGVTLELR